MKNKSNIFLLLLIFALAVHLFVYFDYQILKETISFPVQWDAQFYALTLFSFLISLLLIFTNKLTLILLFLKVIDLLIIGYPLGNYLGIETILLISIVLEIIYYLPSKYGSIISIFVIFITFINQKYAISWGIIGTKADSHQLIFFLYITLLLTFMASYMKKIVKTSNEKNLDITRLDFAVKELTEINLNFQNYASSLEEASIENERKRISREMHDIIGYTLTNQLMIIQAILSMKENLPPQIEALLLQSQKQTNEGMIQARSALHKLREFSLDTEKGLNLIYKMVKTFEQVTGITIKIDFSNTPNSINSQIDKTLYRLVQEGMTNAFRHGKATRISILLSVINEVLFVIISDNGIGSSKISEGIGLSGMRERIEVLNGEFEISTMQQGFTVRARIPLNNEVENENIISR